MDEKKISELMGNLDNDLISQELDEIMTDIDIDVDSISQKAHWKLRKEQHTVNKHKKKIMAIAAASIVAVCGVMTVCGEEISDFIQSLMGKTDVYGTVVDGPIYYLENPLPLGEGQNLKQVMFQEDGLDVLLDFRTADGPDVSVKVGGKEIKPGGMEGYNNIKFYGAEPTNSFEFIVDGISYPVVLSTSQPIVSDGKIVEAQPNHTQWISLGYKKIENGIQLLATIDDPSVEIVFFNTPGKDTIKQTSNNRGISRSTREELLPILGYDRDGNVYEFHNDPGDMGRPLTKYTTDAPTGKELSITLPGIVVATEKSIELKVAIPDENEKQTIRQTIDLGLQTMKLESIERTSDTTAQLCFTLNTGEQEEVRIWEAALDSITAESTESLWENGICVMDVTFPSEASELQLYIASPKFIVDGDWTFTIE